MNDPWDVKSVRKSEQYLSCMKINGVPLLPPVLSRECREEMQYYKFLAKEVEKRISVLQPYLIASDSESSEDKTDAPELPECEQSYDVPHDEMQACFNFHIDQIRTVTSTKPSEKTASDSSKHITTNNNLSSNVTVAESSETTSSKFVIDLSLSINETGRNVLDTIKSPQRPSPSIYLPERDYNCLAKTKTDVSNENNTVDTKPKAIKDIVNFNISVNQNAVSDPFSDLQLNQNGPSSLSSKSFTGSLNDIHTESIKESHKVPKLLRQRSYTLLNPSPQLLAHLEVQSLNTGVEMSCISMSESLSNLSSPGKKRRSWDLESAKVKWSSMAMELKQKSLQRPMKNNGDNRVHVARPQSTKVAHVSPPSRARSLLSEKTKFSNSINKTLPKSDPVQKTKKIPSPGNNAASNRAFVKESTNPKVVVKLKQGPDSPKPASQLISESEDPATRVRELYEKMQKQQLLQMAGLVEKQKREQMLLQQVFEEQNNLLYKQLKTICPKSPIEAKEAWGDKLSEVNRGPVSLSQLINHKSPDQSINDSPVSSTLTDTNYYIDHCDDLLKKSRDISGSIKKQHQSRSQNGTKIHTPVSQIEGSRTRTHSPTQRNTPTCRRLNYDTSASSDREYDPILTDRTNDTMADLNVTFPSDHTEDCHSFNHSNPVLSLLYNSEVKATHASPLQNASMHCKSTDSAITNMEKKIQNSINNSVHSVKPSSLITQPTPKQRAAATKIVAHAKGFLVRRLMRTDRVQATVQTIKDALLCALQLHQDREGIRGADVDLHRRLIQQITAACYSLHETFIGSSPAERCATIAADRARRRSLAARPNPRPYRQTDF